MNPIDNLLQIVIPLGGLLELLLAISAYLIDRHSRSNRYLAMLLALLAANSLFTSMLTASNNTAQIETWLYFISGTYLAIGPSLLVATVALLQPENWPTKRWQRWLWHATHLPIFIPGILTVSDLLLDTGLLYTGPGPGYTGGFIPPTDYMQGTLASLLRLVNAIGAPSLALLLTGYCLWSNRQATSPIRKGASWLLAAQLVTLFSAIGLYPWPNELVPLFLINLAFILVYPGLLLQGQVSDKALRQRLVNIPLRRKLYAGLGVSITGLLIITGVSLVFSRSNEQLVNQATTHQRELTKAVSDINNLFDDLQQHTLQFYDTWRSTGFEDEIAVGGFDLVRQTYFAPMHEDLDQIQDRIKQLQSTESSDTAQTILMKLHNSADLYDTTLRDMADQIERLGHKTTGEMGQLWGVMSVLRALLTGSGLASPALTFYQIDQAQNAFFINPTNLGAQTTQEFIQELQDQASALNIDDQITPGTKAELQDLSSALENHFRAAAEYHFSIKIDWDNLTLEIGKNSIQIDMLFEHQQQEFDITMSLLQRRQNEATRWTIILVFITLFASTTIAYYIAGHITRPVQALGETAKRLGAGELTARADVHGRDEIGATAAALNMMTERVRELLSGLERQVADRTQVLQRRTAYLEAASQVSRAASTILDTHELTREAVDLIREQFNLYYVGLFIIDASNERAVLQAGTGEYGQAMLARGHSIQIGEGMVGWSIANNQARVAQEAETDAVRLTTTELPETQSEAAIPMRSRGKVLGALTVQDSRPNAFGKDAIVALQTMADQIAVAIENARLLQESQETLETLRRTYSEMSAQAWRDTVHRSRVDLAFCSDQHGVYRVEDLQQDRITQGNGDDEVQAHHPLAMPIKVRDKVIGVLDTYKLTEKGDWTPEEMAFISQLIEQLGQSLESARLHEQAQQRAHAEQVTRQITERVHATTNVQVIVRTAAEEIVKALGGTCGFVKRWGGDEYSGQQGSTTAFYPPGAQGLVGDQSDLEADRVLRDGITVANSGGNGLPATLATPIKVRDQIVGVLGLQEIYKERIWSPEEISLVETAAGQVAQALETAYLLDQTRRQARREQLVSEVTDKIRAASDIDSILRTAVREIRHALDARRGAIRLGTETHLLSPQMRDDTRSKSPREIGQDGGKGTKPLIQKIPDEAVTDEGGR